jgi:hypothetical protein
LQCLNYSQNFFVKKSLLGLTWLSFSIFFSQKNSNFFLWKTE